MRLSVAGKLALGFGSVVAAALVLALFQLSTIRQAIQYMESSTQRDGDAYAKAVQIANQRMLVRGLRERAFTAAALAARGVGPGMPQDQDLAYQRESRQLITLMEELRAMGAQLSHSGLSAQRKTLWADLTGAMDNVIAAEKSIEGEALGMMAALRAGRIEQANSVRDNILGLHDRLNGYLDRIMSDLDALNEAKNRDLATTYEQAERTSVAAIVLTLALGALAAFVIGRSIRDSLNRYVQMARSVGEGDLAARVPVSGDDELSMLGRHLNQMSVNLSQVAGSSRAAAENVNAATSQIRASAQEQAAAAAEQLSALEETSATLTEITQSGAQISQRAQELEHSAQGASDAAETGLKVVEETVQAMESIGQQVETVAGTIVSLSERTQAIGEIILTVTNIAERSHLLSLNAAIEAAAAGEHGRTFSVVAGEIKKLADQAREATDRVRTILGEVQHGINVSVMLAEEASKRAEAGRRQGDSTDRTIRALADAIQESLQAFQQIVAATNQHQIGLEQVMQALSSIRHSSSQTNASTRQLEQAARDLSRLSETMIETVRNYRL